MLINAKKYTVRRYDDPVDWSTGEADVGDHETLEIWAVVMPIGERQIEFLPEGVEASKARAWLSKPPSEPLRQADQELQQTADEVLVEGRWYACVRSHNRPAPGAHCDALLVRKAVVSE